MQRLIIAEKTIMKMGLQIHADDMLTLEEEKLLLLHQALRLQIELVPASCFWSNVRSNIEEADWDRIRKIVFDKANHLCEICGGKGKYHPVECHEVWVYETPAFVQRLDFFQALCPMCHEVKHLGLAGLRGTWRRAFKRFTSMNQLDEKTAVGIENAVFKQWEIRTDSYWKLDVKHLQQWGVEAD
jgi:5-methylcytosine-specific restriction endonuclease McrA